MDFARTVSSPNGHGMERERLFVPLSIWIAMGVLCVRTVAGQDFRFDSSISKTVLENYLSRSISFTELLHDDLTRPRNSRGVDPHDNMRLILSTKAKFIGRALMVWGREQNLATF